MYTLNLFAGDHRHHAHSLDDPQETGEKRETFKRDSATQAQPAVVTCAKPITELAGIAYKSTMWRGARAAESGGLENRCPVRDRGFESHPLRHLFQWLAGHGECQRQGSQG